MASAMVSGLQDFMGPRSRYLADSGEPVLELALGAGDGGAAGDGLDLAADAEAEADEPLPPGRRPAAAAFWLQHFCHMF